MQEKLNQLEEKLYQNGMSSEGYEDEVDEMLESGSSLEEMFDTIEAKYARAEALAEGN